MSIKKRVAALVCSCMLAASLVSCADTSYICKADDVSVNAGVYIYYVINQINNQEYTYYYTNGKMSEDIINESYGDGTMTVGDYARSAAYDTCVRIAVAQLKFNELGLELTSEEKASIAEAVDASWDADYYESIGVAKSSIEQLQTGAVMLDRIFMAYYDKGGIEEVSESEINKHLTDNYVRFKLISIPKDKDDKGEAAKKKAEEFKELAEEKTFDEIIEDYEKEQAKDSDKDKDKDDEKEHDHNVMVNKTSSTYSSNEVVKHIDKDMSDDEVDAYDDDYYWYVVQKLDVLGYDSYIDDNRAALLDEIKADEFEEKINSWIEESQITRNEDSYSRYTPKSVYGKYTKYMEKKQQ